MRYYIVQHDLDSLLKLPGWIWKTGLSGEVMPHNYQLVQPGERWVAYALDAHRITGIYECENTATFREAPPSAEFEGEAWFIEGKEFGVQPKEPVEVQRLEDIVERPLGRNPAIIVINGEDFEKLQKYVLGQ